MAYAKVRFQDHDHVFVDRQNELDRLRTLARQQGPPRMALLYGRRRVGKTFLLTHAWDPDEAFYFTASATTPDQNRRQLVAEAARWSGEDLREEDHPTWRTVFRSLLSLMPERPLVLVLDEFQYLADDERGLATLASELNAVWESRSVSRRQAPLLLVLSGSQVSTLEALSTGAAPLYGRFAWVARLDPFDYRDAGEMTAFDDLRDRVRAYAVFGGMPRYLAAVDPRRSLDDNVATLAMEPRGEVRVQVETALLQEQGLRQVSQYQAILRAVAGGRTELNEIAQGAGLASDTPLRDKVNRLVDLGWLERRRNLGAARTAPYRYQLVDPAFRFHYAWVARFESALEVGEARSMWQNHVEPHFDAYVGLVFEEIARQAYVRLRDEAGLPAVRQWSRWEGRDRDGQPLEIDIACRLADGGVLTGSVKWNPRAAGARLYTDHLRDLERLAASGVGWASDALEDDAPLLFVTAGGVGEAFRAVVREEGRRVTVWTLDELYA